MDYTRGHKATTHSATPLSQDEELKASIMVIHLFARWHIQEQKGTYESRKGVFRACIFCVLFSDTSMRAGAAAEADSGSDTEFLILPPNTQAKNVTASYRVVNVQAYKEEFEQEISAILFTPSIAEGGAQSSMPQDASGGSASQAPKTLSGKAYEVHIAACMRLLWCKKGCYKSYLTHTTNYFM